MKTREYFIDEDGKLYLEYGNDGDKFKNLVNEMKQIKKNQYGKTIDDVYDESILEVEEPDMYFRNEEEYMKQLKEQGRETIEFLSHELLNREFNKPNLSEVLYEQNLEIFDKELDNILEVEEPKEILNKAVTKYNVEVI